MATQSQIARKLGISQATVSMALHGAGRMSHKMREQVRGEALRMGYRLNNSAQAIRSGRFGCISLLLSMLHQNSFLPFELMPGILGEVRRQGTQLTVIGSPDSELVEEEFVQEALKRWSSDGLLINYTHDFPSRMVDLIRDYRVPSIWINGGMDYDSVHPDDFEATACAVRELHAAGHRKIGYVDLTRTNHYSVRDRYDGYAETMAGFGLSLRPLTTLVPRPARYAVLKNWLEDLNRPTAVITYEDREAIPLFAAAMEMGLAVPGDLSIVTIHDYPADNAGVAFTTVQNDFRKVGSEGVKMLMEKIKEPGKLIASRKIAPKLVPGQTLAAPSILPRRLKNGH